MKRVELRVDLPESFGLGEGLQTSAVVCLPEEGSLPSRPIIAFCWPGGGYSRGYYDIQYPGRTGYSQGEHHADRGVVLVGCDHIGVGDSSEADRSQLSHENVAAINRFTADEILRRLAQGDVDDGYPPVSDPVVFGIGQSFGGELLIVQQGRQRSFDGIAVLGYSAIGIVLPRPPHGGVSNNGGHVPPPDEMSEREVQGYFFHWEDVDADLYREDMKGEHPKRQEPLPMWASRRRPGGRHWSHAPGVVAHWANVIECPVFIGVGERDVCPDPYAEPSAYRRSKDVSLFVCPRMGHIHNFAGTRELLWERLLCWMQTVAATQPA